MSHLPRFLLKFFFLAAMLLSLPLIGAWLAGFPIARYLEFPPQTRYVQHAPFSWSAFFVIALLITAGVLAPVIKGWQSYRGPHRSIEASAPYPFPWWGWLGTVIGLITWFLAWTRFGWFAE